MLLYIFFDIESIEPVIYKYFYLFDFVEKVHKVFRIFENAFHKAYSEQSRTRIKGQFSFKNRKIYISIDIY